MLKLYFFKSSRSKDGIDCMAILSNSLTRACALASKQFIKHGCKGVPEVLAI